MSNINTYETFKDFCQNNHSRTFPKKLIDAVVSERAFNATDDITFNTVKIFFEKNNTLRFRGFFTEKAIADFAELPHIKACGALFKAKLLTPQNFAFLNAHPEYDNIVSTLPRAAVKILFRLSDYDKERRLSFFNELHNEDNDLQKYYGNILPYSEWATYFACLDNAQFDSYCIIFKALSKAGILTAENFSKIMAQKDLASIQSAIVDEKLSMDSVSPENSIKGQTLIQDYMNKNSTTMRYLPKRLRSAITKRSEDQAYKIFDAYFKSRWILLLRGFFMGRDNAVNKFAAEPLTKACRVLKAAGLFNATNFNHIENASSTVLNMIISAKAQQLELLCQYATSGIFEILPEKDVFVFLNDQTFNELDADTRNNLFALIAQYPTFIDKEVLNKIITSQDVNEKCTSLMNGISIDKELFNKLIDFDAAKIANILTLWSHIAPDVTSFNTIISLNPNASQIQRLIEIAKTNELPMLKVFLNSPPLKKIFVQNFADILENKSIDYLKACANCMQLLTEAKIDAYEIQQYMSERPENFNWRRLEESLTILKKIGSLGADFQERIKNLEVFDEKKFTMIWTFALQSDAFNLTPVDVNNVLQHKQPAVIIEAIEFLHSHDITGLSFIAKWLAKCDEERLHNFNIGVHILGASSPSLISEANILALVNNPDGLYGAKDLAPLLQSTTSLAITQEQFNQLMDRETAEDKSTIINAISKPSNMVVDTVKKIGEKIMDKIPDAAQILDTMHSKLQKLKTQPNASATIAKQSFFAKNTQNKSYSTHPDILQKIATHPQKRLLLKALSTLDSAGYPIENIADPLFDAEITNLVELDLGLKILSKSELLTRDNVILLLQCPEALCDDKALCQKIISAKKVVLTQIQFNKLISQSTAPSETQQILTAIGGDVAAIASGLTLAKEHYASLLGAHKPSLEKKPNKIIPYVPAKEIEKLLANLKINPLHCGNLDNHAAADFGKLIKALQSQQLLTASNIRWVTMQTRAQDIVHAICDMASARKLSNNPNWRREVIAQSKGELTPARSITGLQ